MINSYHISYLASTYGSGSYNVSNYNGTNATSTGTGTGTTGTSGAGATAASGGVLSNTGVMAGLIVGVAAATLLVAMVVRIWKRPKQTPVPVADQSDDIQRLQ